MRLRVALLLALGLLFAPATARAGVTWVVNGHGFGHGVGMSQYGAYGYATHGFGYRAILAHYYTGTTIGTIGGPRVVRVLVGIDRGDVGPRPRRRIRRPPGRRKRPAAHRRRPAPRQLRPEAARRRPRHDHDRRRGLPRSARGGAD